MRKKFLFNYRNASRNYRLIRCLLLMAFALLSQAGIAANHYITFDDGHMLVFPDNCIRGIRTSDTQVEVSALDGKLYTYQMATITSISEELPRELPTITSYKYNNKYNHQVLIDAEGEINDNMITAEIVGIGKWLTASFSLSDDNACAYVDGKEQVSKKSRLHFDTDKTYTVGYPGDLIFTRLDNENYGFRPFGREYTVHADFLTDHSTTVPRIDINTVGGEPIASKEIYLDAEIIIDGAGVFPSMTDSVQVRGRGNTTWSSDPDSKNPYRLKFASKKKPLGLKKGKSWVLLSNKLPGSMMTNAIGMKAASIIGVAAANHIIPVDLYVNGVYKGSYNFTEKVGLAGNSVEVEDETVATFINLDCNYDEVVGQRFRSNPYNMACCVKDPNFDEGTTQITLQMIKNRYDAFCKAVHDEADLEEHIDIDYMARYLMLNELICNYEIFHPKSGYCYHENILADSCKFIFGPGWDFDHAYGAQTHANFFKCDTTIDFYTALMFGQSEFFTKIRFNQKVARRLYELWKDFVHNGGIDEMCDFCMEYYQYAKPSLQLNGTAAWDKANYADQSARAARWLRGRANALLERMRAEVILSGDANNDGRVNIQDVTMLIDYLLGDANIIIDMDCADTDGDGNINIDDVTAIINKLLTGE